MNEMTSKERWMAAISMKPVDRLPFWPKLDGAYPQAQVSPFQEMENTEIHEWLGSDQHIGIGSGIREVRKNTSFERTCNDGISRCVYRTPTRELTSQSQFDPGSSSWHPTEFPVKDLEDIEALTEYYEDITLEIDPEELQKAKERYHEIGESAVTTNAIGESPLMHWVEWLAGVENAHFLLMDHQEEVETLFDGLHNHLIQKAKMLCEHSVADVLYMIENTSTTLISPDQYREYCLKHVGEYAEITDAAGRNLILHMCGHLKNILPELSTIKAQAFEAFTSPTLGNTTFLDGRMGCPDKCLIGGTNAMLWTKSAKEIIEEIERDLDELPHHRGIVVTSAGVMPPMCKPETIKEVCEWVKQYPISNTE